MTENTCFSFDTSSAIQPFQLLIEGAGEIRPVEKLTGFPSRPAPYSRPASVDEPLIAHRNPGFLRCFVKRLSGRSLSPGIQRLLHRLQHGLSRRQMLRPRLSKNRNSTGIRRPAILRDMVEFGGRNKKRPLRAAQAIPLVPPAWRWIDRSIGKKTPICKSCSASVTILSTKEASTEPAFDDTPVSRQAGWR